MKENRKVFFVLKVFFAQRNLFGLIKQIKCLLLLIWFGPILQNPLKKRSLQTRESCLQRTRFVLFFFFFFVI